MTELIPETLSALRVPIASLQTMPGNPRRGDVALIAESLQANGQYRPIVVRRPQGEVLAGNHTLMAARSLGWSEIAATFVECSDAEAARIALVDNRASDVAGYDDELLAGLLASLGGDFVGTGFATADAEALLAGLLGEPVGLTDPDAAPSLPQTDPVTVPGEVWLMREPSVVGEQVLELRSAGASFATIATHLHLPSEEAARAAYRAALDESDERFDLGLALRRIDRLLQVAWAKAVKGDLAAIDRVLKLEERRDRLVMAPREVKHELREAFDDSAASAAGYDADLDAALLAAGRAIADRIDAAMCGDDPTETTKALYMVPHLVNILREMGATPKARLEEAVASASIGRVLASGEVGGGGGTAARRQRAAQRLELAKPA